MLTALIISVMWAMLVPAVQDAAPAAPRVQEVVRRLEARYQGAQTLQATFLERYSEGRQQVRVESGDVFFSRPNRMRWNYAVPEEKMFLVDGTNVWFYVPADRTATRAKIRESADWQTPLALILGKVKLSRLCGKVELLPPPANAAAGTQTLRCLPRGRDAAFSEVLFDVDAEYWITRVQIREPGGITTEFRFGNWRRDVAMAEAMFHFQPPPGVAIVDEGSIAGPVR